MRAARMRKCWLTAWSRDRTFEDAGSSTCCSGSEVSKTITPWTWRRVHSAMHAARSIDNSPAVGLRSARLRSTAFATGRRGEARSACKRHWGILGVDRGQGHRGAWPTQATSVPCSFSPGLPYSAGSLLLIIAFWPIWLVILTPLLPLLPVTMACFKSLPSKIEGSSVAKLHPWT